MEKKNNSSIEKFVVVYIMPWAIYVYYVFQVYKQHQKSSTDLGILCESHAFRMNHQICQRKAEGKIAFSEVTMQFKWTEISFGIRFWA